MKEHRCPPAMPLPLQWLGAFGGGVVVCVMLAVVFTVFMNAGYEDLTRDERYGLATDFPGGTFIDSKTYRRCESGYWVLYKHNQLRAPTGGTCYVLTRE